MADRGGLPLTGIEGFMPSPAVSSLAMLALFGAPHLASIVAAYDEAFPLQDGWRERIPLHQLHPLLVHAVLFGGGYGARVGAAARRMISPTIR